MSNAYGQTTKLFSTPYITLDEYKSAPTAIDFNNLVVDSSDPDAQDAELANNIARASSWIDTYCNQVLSATVQTEQTRSRFTPDGYIKIHPKQFPIVALTSFNYGSTPNNLTAYPDCSQSWVEDESIVIPWAIGNTYSSAGPLSFGLPSSPRGPIFVKYSYVSGFANTLTGASASLGATSITVDDGTGIVAGSYLTIFDGQYTETIEVASTYTFGSTTVPLTAGLLYAHESGVAVSALPPAVKEAAILATTAFLKVRGDYSMTMQVTSAVGSPQVNTAGMSYDLSLAKELLFPFRRMR